MWSQFDDELKAVAKKQGDESKPARAKPIAPQDEPRGDLDILTDPNTGELFETVSIKTAALYACRTERRISQLMSGPAPAIESRGKGQTALQ